LHLSELVTWTQRLLEQDAPRKLGRPPPIVIASTTKLIRLQSDLEEHVKGKYQFRNIRNGTRIMKKGMADCSAMKFHLEKNNLPYYTFCPHSEKPMKAVIRHLPPDTPVKIFPTALRTYASTSST
jgi:hypothetical protein